MHRQDTEEQTEEEFKRELEQTTLNRLRDFLCGHLEPERFFPYLQTKQYLDPESCERIRSAGTTQCRVSKMLDILIRSGPHPLKVLIRAIERNGPTQKFVTDKMKGELGKISRDPENLGRLEAIRMQFYNGPTCMYIEQNAGQPPPPPPYEVPGNPAAISQASSLYSASTFAYGHLSTGFQGTSVKTPDLTVPDGNHQHTRFQPQVDIVPKQILPERRLPISSSEDSILAISPSIFHTDDFPPPYHDISTANYPGHGNTLPPEPMAQMVSDQYQEERKISLHVAVSGSTSTSTQCTMNTQEKEITNNSLTTGTTVAFPRRVPSEHDASVVTTRNSSVNMSPTPLSAGSSTSAKPSTDDSSSQQILLYSVRKCREPIPSIEVDNEKQTSIFTRLPPTEHDDTSVVSNNASDGDTSSLEISVDSEVSEQQ